MIGLTALARVKCILRNLRRVQNTFAFPFKWWFIRKLFWHRFIENDIDDDIVANNTIFFSSKIFKNVKNQVRFDLNANVFPIIYKTYKIFYFRQSVE